MSHELGGDDTSRHDCMVAIRDYLVRCYVTPHFPASILPFSLPVRCSGIIRVLLIHHSVHSHSSLCSSRRSKEWWTMLVTGVLAFYWILLRVCLFVSPSLSPCQTVLPATPLFYRANDTDQITLSRRILLHPIWQSLRSKCADVRTQYGTMYMMMVTQLSGSKSR